MTKQFYQATETKLSTSAAFCFLSPIFKINYILPSVKASHARASKGFILGLSYRCRVRKTIGAISGPETAIIHSQLAIVRCRLYSMETQQNVQYF